MGCRTRKKCYFSYFFIYVCIYQQNPTRKQIFSGYEVDPPPTISEHRLLCKFFFTSSLIYKKVCKFVKINIYGIPRGQRASKTHQSKLTNINGLLRAGGRNKVEGRHCSRNHIVTANTIIKKWKRNRVSSPIVLNFVITH